MARTPAEHDGHRDATAAGASPDAAAPPEVTWFDAAQAGDCALPAYTTAPGPYPTPPEGHPDPAPGTYGGPVLFGHAPPLPPRRRRSGSIALLLAATLTVVGGSWWLASGDVVPPTGTPASEALAGADAAASTAAALTVGPPSPPGDAQAAARAELEALAARSAPPAGAFVAQLASGHAGMPATRAAGAPAALPLDEAGILAEHRRLRARLGAAVLLLEGRLPGPPAPVTVWTTVYDGGFASAEQVRAWCATRYSVDASAPTCHASPVAAPATR